MKRFIIAILLILLIVFLADRITKQIFGYFSDGKLSAALLLEGVSLEETEATILEHYKNELGEEKYQSMLRGEYEIETVYTDLNQDSHKDLIVLLKSAETCGSGGCLTSIFTQNESKEFSSLNFSYAVKNIIPLDSYTTKFRDLRINDDTTHRMVWNGSLYVLESI